MTVSDFVILTVTSLSVFFDLSFRRIPNWLILFGLLAGLILNSYQGFTQLTYSILGFALGRGVFIVPFAFGWMGAGDVKYFGVVGALLGVTWLPRVFFYSALVAGVVAVGYMAVGRYTPGFFRGSWLECKVALLTLGRILPEPIKVKTSQGAHSVPWGVAFGLGTVLAYYIDRNGQWAGF